MKTFLLFPICIAIAAVQTTAVHIISFPPPSSNLSVTVFFNYTYNAADSTSTFQLVWNVADDSSDLSNGWIGLGFQNGRLANTTQSDRDMYGPQGADYFALRGPATKPTMDYLTLGAKPAKAGKGTRPILQQSFQIGNTIPGGSRITGFAMGPGPIANFTTYTATITCDKGSKGMVDFGKPVATLIAFGPVKNGQIQYHTNNMEKRGFRIQNPSSLVLYNICSPSSVAATANAFSHVLMSFLVAAAVALHQF